MLFSLSFVVCATAAPAAIVVPPAGTYKMNGPGFEVTIKPKGNVLMSYELKFPGQNETLPMTLSTYDIHLSFSDMGISFICEKVAAEVLPTINPPPSPGNPKAVTPVYLIADVPGAALKDYVDAVTDAKKKTQLEEVAKASKCNSKKAQYMGKEWKFQLFYLELQDGRKTYEVTLVSDNPSGPSPDDAFFTVTDVGGSPYMCGGNMGKTKNILGPCFDDKGVPIVYKSSGSPWTVIIAVVVVVVLLLIGLAVFLWMKKTSTPKFRKPVASGNKR